MKILIIQLRKDDMKQHEYDCFLKYSGLQKDELISLDVFHEEPTIEKVKNYNGLIIGGSGEFKVVSNDLPEINKKLVKIIRWCFNANFPYFGACYGHHLATISFDGKLTKEKAFQEVGSFEIKLTEQGKSDLVFKNLSNSFFAQLGHQDSAIQLPEKAILLASSVKCPIQAFTFLNKKFYSIQFHPELAKQDLVTRVKYYMKNGYAEDSSELQSIIDNAKDSDEVARLIKLFIENM